MHVTDQQLEVIELMKKLGSKGHVVNASGVVKVSIPFSEDMNPNITVWANGSWHDFSNPSHKEQWEALGLKDHGYLQDLRNAVKNRFPKMWAECEKPQANDKYSNYINSRMLTGDIRIYHGSLAFPIYNEFGEIIGIQTRRIDGQEPKNMMVHGSDGKNGFFIRYSQDGIPLIICEGATDTYTLVNGSNMIGALSASMLDGVKKWIANNKYRVMYFVLAFDADAAGTDAQGKMLEYLESIGIERSRIKVMAHEHGKDLNDEINNNNRLKIEDLDEVRTDLFVKVVDEVNEEMESAVWFGFFPPDFPTMKHINSINYKNHLFVFPESFGRSKVNSLMWNNKSSAYILRGW